MVSALASAALFGIPLAIVVGILTIACLFVTALLGYLVLKGRYSIPFAWHMRMAALTLVLALVHAVLVIVWLNG